MGNSVLGGAASAGTSGGTITKFYTSQAWIEGRAEDQLNHVASWAGVKQVAAFPDLHPGKYGPVGCAVLANRIYPQLIGNDIGCGMALFVLDLPRRKLKLEKALRRLRVLGEAPGANQAARLAEIGLPAELFQTSLGTIGGGNHFCELQTLAEAAPEAGLDANLLYLLIHSGSRGLGSATLGRLPQGAFSGLTGEGAAAYVAEHDQAVSWARLNRRIIAERAADALRAEAHLIVDAPHNLLTADHGKWLHRKGAADAIGLVPLAGSRATPSYLLRAMGHADALGSTAHGAGRRYDRSSMHGRIRAKRSDIEAAARTPFGGRVICEDKDLLIEEAPLAYKDAGAVVADLEVTGAAQAVAKFHPLITFKKTRAEGRS